MKLNETCTGPTDVLFAVIRRIHFGIQSYIIFVPVKAYTAIIDRHKVPFHLKNSHKVLKKDGDCFIRAAMRLDISRLAIIHLYCTVPAG